MWWTESGRNFDLAEPADWGWTVMLRLPEFVTQEYFTEVVKNLIDRKKSDMFKLARLERFHEGTSVQIMHIGPYDQEQPNIEKMHAFARANGYDITGKHHELYFGDPHRTAPEKLRTILRTPIANK